MVVATASVLFVCVIPAAGSPTEIAFQSPRPAEVLARITVRCDACDWGTVGREAVTFSVGIDGNVFVHLPVVRSGVADYVVLLGPVGAGSHTLRIEQNPVATARELRRGDATSIEDVGIQQVVAGDPEYTALSLAPFIYARPNTIGNFTDVPVFMWYEMEPAGVGTRYRYSVVFTNEDGGTPADRLMATWGRTTDIEYIYSVVVDATGKILVDDFQGPEHATLPFRGERDGRHPRLWVVTDNNMVEDDRGTTFIRYAPAPVAFPLRSVSREAVMDANPWLYAVMAQELAREGKIVGDAPPGKGTIPDARRFVYIEACGEVGNAALAFAVQAGDQWVPSDRGVAEYRIVRNGCFRVAVPLPDSMTLRHVRAIRAQAFERAPRDGSPAPPPTPVRLTRINTVFMLDQSYRPGGSRLRWEGLKTVVPGGLPVEFPLP